MRREDQVKPGDVGLLRADPKRNKGPAGSAGRPTAAQINAEWGHFNSRANSNSANTPEL